MRLITDKTFVFERGGWFNFKSMNIDLAELLDHDCKSIVDQMKEKMLISYLDDFTFLFKSWL